MRYVVLGLLKTFQGVCAFYLNLIESDLGTEGFERVAKNSLCLHRRISPQKGPSFTFV